MKELTVKDIMTTDLITIGPDENIEVAEEVMRAGRIHHLPVTERNILVGIVTQGDLYRAEPSSLVEIPPAEVEQIKAAIPVRMVMSATVSTVSPQTSAIKAAKMLRKHKYGCLPVVDENGLCGIVTEGDFVSLVIHALDDLSSSELQRPSNGEREKEPSLAR